MITYDDKVQGQASGLPENQKWTFGNANEVKTQVNTNITATAAAQSAANAAQSTATSAASAAAAAQGVADLAQVQRTVTEKKRYYFGEMRTGRAITTATGATTASAGSDVSDYIEIDPSTSITMFTTNFSSVTMYGWTYDANFVAISEIRAAALIGVNLSTYTFTTPSNAKYLQVYTRNGGAFTAFTQGWRHLFEIQSTNTFTYNTPIRPENFSGTTIQKVQAAVDLQRWTSSVVQMDGYYEITEAIIVHSNTKIILNGKIKGAVGIRDNLIRNAAVRNPAAIIAAGNRYISITGTGTFEGSDENWGGYPASGVSGQSWRPISVFLANVENFDLRGVTFKSTSMWCFCAEQSRYGTIGDITFDQDGRQANQDGINIRHGSHHIAVNGIKGTTFDDIFAITNLVIGSDLNILGTTVYDPLKSNLDMEEINYSDIQTLIEYEFATVSPPHFGGSVLLLCEDGLKIKNCNGQRINTPIHVGFSAAQYWGTTPAVLGDMMNLNFTDCTKPVFINRPLTNCSFINCAEYDSTGINKGVVIPATSLRNLRKYNTNNFEWFATIPSFAPTDIADCGIWFDASNAGSLSMTGASVNQWSDLSGNARHVTATLTARPTYSAQKMLGKPAIFFDGINDMLRSARITAFQGLSGFTIVMVGGASDAKAGGSVFFHGIDANTRTQLLNNFYTSDMDAYGVIANGSSSFGQFAIDQGTLQRTVIIYDGTATGNANRLRMWVNGTQRTLTFTGTIPATTENSASSRFGLGGLDFASPVYVAGYMSEVFCYTRAITANELALIEAGTSAKWMF